MKKLQFILMASAFALFVACDSGEKQDDKDKKNDQKEKIQDEEIQPDVENSTEMVPLDISEMGIPVTFDAPLGAEVNEGLGMAEMEDGTKQYNFEVSSDNFILDVTMFDENLEMSIEEFVADAKELAMEEEGFVGIISEETSGFVYQLDNEEGTDYSFYYVFVKDNKAIEFATGLNFSNYSLEEVTKLFEAAKTAY